MITLSSLFSILNIFAGVLTAAGIVYFILGSIIYYVRLGLPSRELGINFMCRGCSCLFIVIVMLAIVRHVKQDPQVLITVVVVVLVIYAFINIKSIFAFFEPAPPSKK